MVTSIFVIIKFLISSRKLIPLSALFSSASGLHNIYKCTYIHRTTETSKTAELRKLTSTDDRTH